MSGDERRARLDEIFARALALPEDARPAFLDEACAGTDLRAEVDELLRLAAGEWPELDDRGAVEAALDEALGEARGEPTILGRRYGAWRVVEELGRGGMGAVYGVERADGEFEQRAALKLLQQGMDSALARQRFEHERQILALLDHPNIARLLDGGTGEDGRPFLVMELVRGRPLLRYCDECRLAVEERLALFREVAGALQYAHRHLVVHRDVKPSNIAVTDDGAVKLLDFGIAKLLAPAEELRAVTREAARVLTPEYASPEQLRGEPITTATDVYQLGLLLFELLAGSRAQPVTGLTGSALERAVCERPVERPSARVARERSSEVAAARGATHAALARRLEGDLDAIVAAATRKEPDRRYASIAELLDDVDRHLRGLPVRARPDRLSYRAAKFVARHRAAVAWAAVAALVGAWGTVGWVGQRMRAADEARRAAEIERVLGQLFTFAETGPRTRPPSARDYLDQAATLVRERLREQPASQSRLLAVLGRAYSAAGFYADSAATFEQALATRPAGGTEDAPAVAAILSEMARSEHYIGRFAAAEEHLTRALELRRHLGTKPDRRALLEMGDLEHTQGRLVEAERVLREAVGGLREDGGGDALAEGLRDLGNVLRDRGAHGEAEACYRESMERFRASGYDADRLAGTAVEPYYARLLILEGRLVEADALLAGYLARLERLHPEGHPLLATALREAGFLRLEQGRLDEASAELGRAREVLRRWLGEDHPLVPRNAAHEAEVMLRRGRSAEAVAAARAVLAQFERLGLGRHPAAVDTRITLGDALLAERHGAQAADALRPGLAVAMAEFVEGDARTRRLMALLSLAESRG